jgi:hypothetical protein
MDRASRNFGNGDAHFGPHPWPAPYTELGTDPFRLISHPTKTTVQIAPSLKRFRIDSATIVTNDYSQGVVQVLNLNLDLCRFGMTYRVRRRFVHYQRESLLDCRVQRQRRALDEDSKSRNPPGCHVAENVRNGSLET